MKNRRFWLLIVITILFIGCNKNKNKLQAYLDMKEFVLDEYNRKSPYLLFFETSVKNEIVYLDTDDLRSIIYRKTKNNQLDQESYFKDFMTGKTISTCEDFGECFTITPAIAEKYKKKKLKNSLMNTQLMMMN